jgi:hypothetical protein
VPYIAPFRRELLDSGKSKPITAGELNYRLTKAVLAYVEEEGLDYRVINDVLGALEGAKAEFYRRVAVPYEEAKIAQNGDVYPGEPAAPTDVDTGPPLCVNCA